MKEITLPSGRELKITPAVFTDASALYKSIALEGSLLRFDPKEKIDVNLIKDGFCVLISSDRIEKAVWKCFERSTYNGLKITQDTFEDEKAREDYFTICKEVALVNVAPFLKGLSVEFDQVRAVIQGFIQK